MKIKYKGRYHDGVEIDGYGVVAWGGVIDLPREVAEGVMKGKPENWELVEEKKAKKEDK